MSCHRGLDREIAAAAFAVEKAIQAEAIQKYIRHEDGKWNVYSEAGKRMGSYDTEDEAKHRLKQIEWFKYHPDQK